MKFRVNELDWIGDILTKLRDSSSMNYVGSLIAVSMPRSHNNNNNNNNVRLTCQGQTNCMNLRHGQSLGEGIGSFSETES